MVRTVIQETDASITYAGGTWTNNSPDSSAGASAYKSTLVSGATCSIAIASGKNAVAVTGIITYGTQTFTVKLDGVTVNDPQTGSATWTRINGAQSGTVSLYRAIIVYMTLNPATSHTLLITNAAATSLFIDEIETYVYDTPGTKCTVFGNSIVAGVGASPTVGAANSQAFASVVSGMLGLTENNAGVNGEGLSTATFTVPSPMGWLRANPAAYSASPWFDQQSAVGIIMDSYNDLRTENDVHHDSFAVTATNGYYLKGHIQRLREMIIRFNYSTPTSPLVVCGIGYATSTVSAQGWQQTNYANATAALGMTWNTAIQALCQESGLSAIYVDTRPWMQSEGADSYLVDGSHPNNNGHLLLARAIVSALNARGWVHPLARVGGAF